MPKILFILQPYNWEAAELISWKRPDREAAESTESRFFVNPNQIPYYRYVEDQLEVFGQVHEDRFERIYGFFRPPVNRLRSGSWI